MRGCSYYYGKLQAKKFLKDNKIKMIIRGHEVQIEGFSYQKTSLDEKLTLTIFSAPNYCDTYKNKGAVAIIHNV
jgi:serine/threonine-protein phosphatase 2B catalytic subunit